MRRSTEFMTVSAALVAATGAVALADISDPAITFTATSSAGTGSYTVALGDGAYNGDDWSWAAQQPIEITADGGEVILTLTQGSAFFAADPVIALGFSAIAGNADTEFSIESGVLSFDLINAAIGRSSAGITLTESTGDTATLSGTRDGGTLFSALFNGGNTFSNLLAGPYVENDAFGTEDATDEFPGDGQFTLVGDTSDMQTKWGMNISAGDQVSGTSVFVVIPTPGSLVLLAIGGTAMVRRRR